MSASALRISGGSGVCVIGDGVKTSGKLKRLSLRPIGDGFGGVVALRGLEDWKGAGEEGVEDVVEDGLLLESRWVIAGGCSFLVRALGRVPNNGSAGLSTWLLISDGTDSVLLIFGKGRNDILHGGASFVHLL